MIDTPEPETTAALGRRLTDTLAEGWSKGRPDLMLEVFDENAVFIETPFSEPMRRGGA